MTRDAVIGIVILTLISLSLIYVGAWLFHWAFGDDDRWEP